MIKQICQFVAAAGLVGVALTPLSAEAKYQSVDGHTCSSYVASGIETADCPSPPTGSAFNPATINFLIVDGYTPAGYVATSACRRSFGDVSVTCGYSSYEAVPTARTYTHTPNLSAWQSGNAYDYRYVHVVLGAGSAADVAGMYVASSD